MPASLPDRSAPHRQRRPALRLGARLLLLPFSLVSGTVPATVPATVPGPSDAEIWREFQVRHWTTANGLPDICVHTVVQDGEGYLWLGTRAGVSRFDGLGFTTFDRANTPVLPDNDVRQLAITRDGRLWIVTARGVATRSADGTWVPLADDRRVLLAVDAPIRPDGDSLWIAEADRTWSRWHADRPPDRPAGTTIRGDALATSDDGRLWWLDGGRLVCRDGTDAGQREFPLPKGPPELPSFGTFARLQDSSLAFVHGLEKSDSATLYAVSSEGPVRLASVSGVIDSSAARLEADPWGGLWFQILPRYTFRWHAGDVRPVVLPDMETEDLALCFQADREESFWIGTQWSGLYQLRRRVLPVARAAPGSDTEPSPARAVVALRDGGLAVGTDHGVELLAASAPPARNRPAPPAPLPSDGRGWQSAAAPGEDADLPGGSGAEFINRASSSHPASARPALTDTAEDSASRGRRRLPGVSIRALAEDGAGRLWVGTVDGLFVGRAADGKFGLVSLPVVEDLSDGDRRGSHKIRAIAASRNGALWVAAPRLLSVRPPGGEGFRPVAVFPAESPASSVTEDRDGRIWVTTERSGVVIFDPQAGGDGVWGRLPAERCVPEPGQGARFFLAPTGWLTATNGLASDRVWDVWEDRGGVIWVAGDNGLTCLPPQPATAPSTGTRGFQFTTAHGLPDHRINSLVEDDAGYLWLGTDRGVFRVLRAEMLEVAQALRAKVRAFACGESEGLVGLETNGRITRPGVARTVDGRVWFATVRGLVAFDPRTFDSREPPPPIAIEEIRADTAVFFSTLPTEPPGGPTGPIPASDRNPRTAVPGIAPPRNADRGVVLPPGRGRVLEFRFTSPSFIAPETLRFRYRLHGYEDDWHEAGARRGAYYTNLDPGRYRFQVLAGRASGVWSSAPAEFAFRLDPFLSQTIGFRVGSVIAVAAIAGLLVAVRVREIRRQEALRRENALLRERTRIARDIHDDLGPRLTQLALLTEASDENGLRAAPETRPNAVSRSRRIALLARDLAHSLDGTLWTVEPSGDTLPSFADYLADFATGFLGPGGIRLILEFPDPLPPHPLSRSQKRHLFLFAQEALNNVVKHAAARTVRLRLEAEARGFILEVADDGRGLPVASGLPAAAHPGPHGSLGLASLRDRAEALGGRLRITTAPGKGTSLRLEARLATLPPQTPIK